MQVRDSFSFRTIPWTPLTYGTVIALFLWLIANLPVVAGPRAIDDDGLFVRGAVYLLSGHWLGPYDHLTLVKGPFYSVWIAFAWLMGIPLLISQGLLYAGASLALVRGLRPWLRSEAAALTVLAALLLNPAIYSVGQLRVLREGIYVPMTILLFALVVWWYRWREERPAIRLGLAAVFGAVLGCYWCTREESPWIVPSLLAGLIVPAVALWRETPGPLWSRFSRARVPLIREAALVAAGLVSALVLVGGFSLANYKAYGVSDIVEIKQQEFLTAYSALAKIGDPGHDRRYIVISREGLRELYKVSPAAAELRSYMEGPGATDYAQWGCEAHKIAPCDGEVRSGWFFWALRDAVSAAGHYRTAVDAQHFYAQLASEVNAACEERLIACDGMKFAMPPPFQSFKPEYFGFAAQAFGRAARYAAGFEGMEPVRQPMSCTVDDCGRSRTWPFFLQMVGANTFTPIPWLPFPDDLVRRSDTAGPMPYALRYHKVEGFLMGLMRFYAAAMPAIPGLALACFLATGLICLLRRRVEPLFVIAGIAGLVVLSRLVLIAYLDATSLAAINTTYLSPTYPALILFSLVAIAAFGEAVFKESARALRMPRREAAPAPAE